MSVNYNDGKWHGWNGGECPVHPETVVDLRFSEKYDGDAALMVCKAGYSNCWSHDRPEIDKPNNIIAFRVIKEHKEPREFWVSVPKIEGSRLGVVHVSEQNAKYTNRFGHEIIHVREVLE